MKKYFFLNSFVILILFFSISGYSQNTSGRIYKPDGQVIPDMSWFYQNDGVRPKYVWENREDYMYHERYYPDSAKMTAPEIYAIMRCPWVFNRSMKWQRNPEGTIIAYSEGTDLPLTGEKQISGWYSDPKNKISNNHNSTTFEKQNTQRRRDCAVLPALQFHIGQHPVIEITVLESTDDWQFVVSMKGRSGAPLICSGWQTGAKTIRFDVAQAFKNKGYDLNYPEVHLAIGTWAKSTESSSKIKFEAKLIAQPAVVGCLPVFRTIQNSINGVPLSAIITGASDKSLKVYANVNGQKLEMIKNGEIWKTTAKGLGVGSFHVEFTTNSSSVASSKVLVRVTDGDFWKHIKENNSLKKNNITKSPLTGSFQGTFFFKDAGLASEQMVNSQKDWDEWDKAEAPGEHMHYWESLTRPELHERFSFLNKNGWDLLFLHGHYGVWERFDASGNLAPHGIEQFALYVDEAAKNSLNVEVALSSYPYEDCDNKEWTSGTKPYLQTIEKGFKAEDWHNPENEPFRTIYHQYLTDFINTFKDETNIFAFSSSGEGDAPHINGIKRFLDTKDVIKGLDTNHIIVSEPVHVFPGITQLPKSIANGYTSDLVGTRNYVVGSVFNPDNEMSIYLRLSKSIPNVYGAEGCWPASNLYSKYTENAGSAAYNTWLGSEEYRRNVRDWLYLSLVFRLPLTMTWDENFTADEHLIVSEARKLTNWNQPSEVAKIAVIINDATYKKAFPKLGKFEKLFSALAVDYRLIEDKKQANPGDWVIDPLQKFDSLKYSNPANLPVSIQKTRPFSLSKDYGTRFNLSSDRKTMVAYIINKTNYVHKQYNLAPSIHRVPVAATFELSMLNIPENLNYKLYDLDSKSVVKEGKTQKGAKFLIENTKADYLLIVYP